MNEPVAANPQRRFSRLGMAGVLIVICCGLLVWWLVRPTPAQLLQRGLTAAPRDPLAGENLLQQAIERAGGHYPDAEIGLARLAIRQGDWKRAASLLEGADKSTCRTDLLLALGRDALDAGHLTEGLSVLETVSGRGGADAIHALEILSPVYQEWGRQDELVSAAKRLTEMEPGNPQRWAQLIDMLKGMLREAECLAAIRQAQSHEFSPEFQKELQHRLVQQLLVEGDTAEVRKALEEMRKSEGESVRVRAHEVVLLRLEGKLEAALELVESLAPSVADKTFLYFNRGVLHYDLGRFRDAAHDFEQMVKVQPYHAQAQFKLSEAYRNLGDTERASKHQKLASDITVKRKRINELLKQRLAEPENAALYDELARLHAELGEQAASDKWRHWLAQHAVPGV